MKRAYPFKRNDNLLNNIALRQYPSESPFDESITDIFLNNCESDQDFSIEANLKLNLADGKLDSIIKDDSGLILSCDGFCQSTRWSKLLFVKHISRENAAKLQLDNQIFSINPVDVTGNVVITFNLSLDNNRDVSPDGFARRKYNKLAEKRFIIRTSASGFSNTSWISFKEKGLPEALWFFEIPATGLDCSLQDLKILLNEDVTQFKQIMSESYINKNKLQLPHQLIITNLITEFYYFIMLMAFESAKSDTNIPQYFNEDNCWSIVGEICKKIDPQAWNDDLPTESFNSIHAKYGDDLAKLHTILQQRADMAGVLMRSRTLNPVGTANEIS